MKSMLTILAMILLQTMAGAQNGGISGNVKDAKLGPLINAQVVVKQAGVVRGQALTDYDGDYIVSPLPPGAYDVEVSYQSAKDITTAVPVPVTGRATVNVGFDMEKNRQIIVCWTRTSCLVYRNPLMNTRRSPGTRVVLADELEHMPIQ